MKYRSLLVLPVLLWSVHAGAQALTGSSLTLNTPYNNAVCPSGNNSLTILNQQPGYSGPINCPKAVFEIVDIKRRLYSSTGTPLGADIPVFTIKSNGNVRIGATAANGAYASYKLSVDGDMIAKRCVIQTTNWADYVFAPDYSLPSLKEVETFIAGNKHLPGVPSEAEVKEKGIDMGDMQKVLLQKVEELTLYVIQLKKDSETLQEQNHTMRKELEAIKAAR